MDPLAILILGAIGVFLAIFLPYVITKAAVRNGVVEAHAILDKRRGPSPEVAASSGRRDAHAGAV